MKRMTVAVLSALAVSLTVAPAAASAAPNGDSGHDMGNMPGMNHNAPAVQQTRKPAKDRSVGVARSRQKVRFFEADLLGRNEVPVAGGPKVGDRDGRATGIIRVQGDRITYAFKWKNITAPTLGHIHQGKSGVNGDVKVPLFTTAMPDTVLAAAGKVTVDDPATADAIRKDPAGFYLNLHTKEFPGGAVRGQLHQINTRSDMLNLVAAGDFKAFLNGDQEVPVKGGPKVGDPSASAVGFFQIKGSAQVNYAFAWTGVVPTLGHIHEGKAGVNGDVKVPLFTTAMPDTVIAAAGTVSDLDPTLLRNIKKNPKGFYANLHSAQFPGGAVRGQVFKR